MRGRPWERHFYIMLPAIAGAGSVPALAPVTGRAEQIQGGARGEAVLAQYCPPPQEDSDVPTLFCREQG